MKTWKNSEIVELNVTATANIPTTEAAVDEYENGYFKQGIREGSGSKIDIPYYDK